jgi:cbb3-type cytochrome oxidase subunit 3
MRIYLWLTVPLSIALLAVYWWEHRHERAYARMHYWALE